MGLSHLVQQLTASRDIRAVLSARSVWHASAVVVHARLVSERHRDGCPGRVAVIAGKKVGNAVARNRAKRRLREAVRRTGLPDGFDVVLVARAATTEVPFETLVQQVATGIERATGAAEDSVAVATARAPADRPVASPAASVQDGGR